MNLISVKNVEDIKLVGPVTVALEKQDGNIKAATITDEAGHVVTFKMAATYSDTLGVYIPEPPKTTTQHLIRGVLFGMKMEEFYNDFSEATQKLNAINDAGGKATRTEVEVLSDGTIVAEKDETDDDKPF